MTKCSTSTSDGPSSLFDEKITLDIDCSFIIIAKMLIVAGDDFLVLKNEKQRNKNLSLNFVLAVTEAYKVDIFHNVQNEKETIIVH